MNYDLDKLLEQLGDSDVNVRLNTVGVFIKIGEPVVEPLCKVFTHGSKNARWMASSALGKIGDFRAVESLCKALGDCDSDMRACAVLALGEIGASAVESLCQALRHPEQILRAVPNEWLVRRTTHGMVATDLPDEWVVRACAANALAKIGDVRAVESLRETLRRIDKPLRRFASWVFDERINFKYGAKQTARDAEASALRQAIEKITGSKRAILL